MWRRLGGLLLTSLLTEVGAAFIGAGKSWLERKLQPQPETLPPAASDGSVASTPQGAVVTDAEGRPISFSDGAGEALKKTPEAPMQES